MNLCFITIISNVFVSDYMLRTHQKQKVDIMSVYTTIKHFKLSLSYHDGCAVDSKVLDLYAKCEKSPQLLWFNLNSMQIGKYRADAVHGGLAYLYTNWIPGLGWNSFFWKSEWISIENSLQFAPFENHFLPRRFFFFNLKPSSTPSPLTIVFCIIYAPGK